MTVIEFLGHDDEANTLLRRARATRAAVKSYRKGVRDHDRRGFGRVCMYVRMYVRSGRSAARLYSNTPIARLSRVSNLHIGLRLHPVAKMK